MGSMEPERLSRLIRASLALLGVLAIASIIRVGYELSIIRRELDEMRIINTVDQKTLDQMVVRVNDLKMKLGDIQPNPENVRKLTQVMIDVAVAREAAERAKDRLQTEEGFAQVLGDHHD